MNCRPGCGACCIAPSILSPMLGMPEGKPAGVACSHLSEDMACRIFASPERPSFCASFQAEPSFCGNSRDEALAAIRVLERDSR
ncbi:MAG: YkgJ family cysteine cluster protein [Pseudomonadota bacterium]|nr:YkgJ family cysteine cluster protein [Pseudomonadota bacterium]MEC8346732.1 YkgJ family cysteine cluster protein [Pseudomonadota bacterium]MEC8436877.1 YkgJ family cysteine cluster protein [Pseudomonadota bacterium]MEC8491466.1 YkgJ family cysteine cluster protein [Pseudomonadota bacterium]MEC8621303.1 YkgJ family cysteine cluster protein [Pseudomonadota bacterium]